MGSGQSSAGNKNTNNKGTFSIDLDARGEQPKPAKKQIKKKKKKRNANNERKGADSSQEAKMAETSQQRHHVDSAAAGLAPMAALSEIPSSLPQLVTLNTIPKVESRNDEDSFKLLELDAILERMKAKYNPKPVVLSGKSHCLFEEYEQNLVNCYSKHKDQPLECSKLVREYTAFVFEHRNRILRETAKKDSPLLI